MVFYRRQLPSRKTSWSADQSVVVGNVEIRNPGAIGDSRYGSIEIDFANVEVSFGRGKLCRYSASDCDDRRNPRRNYLRNVA